MYREDEGTRDVPIPIEMHTSYMTDESTFPFYDCYRVVYHANTYSQLKEIKRTGKEIVNGIFIFIQILF